MKYQSKTQIGDQAFGVVLDPKCERDVVAQAVPLRVSRSILCYLHAQRLFIFILCCSYPLEKGGLQISSLFNTLSIAIEEALNILLGVERLTRGY